MAKARRSQKGHYIEQRILPIRSLVRVGLDEQLVGIGQRLQGVFEHVFRARTIAGCPQVFGDGDQVIDYLISVFANHIKRVDTYRIVGVRQIDQHHVVPLTGGK